MSLPPVRRGARIAPAGCVRPMKNTAALREDSPGRENYFFRLGRAVLLLAFGALMHVPAPGGPGVVTPEISPRPFVRVAAQHADSGGAPAVIVAHSLVYAALPRTDGLLDASASSEMPVGTAGVGEPAQAVALARVRTMDGDGVAPREDETAVSPAANPVKASADTSTAGDAPKPNVTERPLPTVASPPSNDWQPPPQASAPSVTPPAYRVPAVVSVARTVSEEELVRQLLDEYTGAFERRDVRAQKALYPNVDGKALKRAYDQIESQRLTLESCGITISGSTANARCRGSATFQPRIGTRPVQVASREWTFDLSKQDTAWRIVNTYVR